MTPPLPPGLLLQEVALLRLEVQRLRSEVASHARALFELAGARPRMPAPRKPPARAGEGERAPGAVAAS